MTRISFLQTLGEWTRADGARYVRLAGAIRSSIERGDLAAGARLPAQRVLARWLGVSRTTVVMAYDALVREEWLASRQGSGTVVRRSPARAVAGRGGAAAVLSARNVVFRGLVERSGAEIEFLGAHFDGLPTVFEAAWKEAKADLAVLLRGHGYMPLGLPDLRAAIARHLERAGLPTKAEQVLVTSGAQQAITLEPSAPPPLAAFARDATVLTVGSLSKLFWGGLRVGWIRGPEPLIARLARFKVVSDLSGSLLSQAVAVRVLHRAPELAALRRLQVPAHLEHATRLLAKHLPDWSYRRPAGGLSLWVRLPAGNAAELAALALRRGVAIVPGTVNSPEGRWADHMRLPFVAEPAKMEEGIRRIAAAWAEHAPERRAERRAVGVLV